MTSLCIRVAILPVVRVRGTPRLGQLSELTRHLVGVVEQDRYSCDAENRFPSSYAEPPPVAGPAASVPIGSRT